MTFWMNGEFKEDTAAINIADRGLLLGDGVFETLLVIGGTPAFLTEHVARLKAGAAALQLMAWPDEAEIGRVVAELARRNGASAGQASARVTVTRGVGPRGVGFTNKKFVETRLVTVSAYDQSDALGPVNLTVGQYQRNENSIVSKFKTLNYLDNTLARADAVAAGADDAVMLNSSGGIACTTTANIFLIRAGAIMTPRVRDGALPGIVRAVLLDAAVSEGIPVQEAPIELSQLGGATIVITNSLIGLRQCEVKSVESGSSADLAVFEQLKSCYAEKLRADIDRRRAAV